MQGYDSVAVKADVELGGTDQRFNLLAGRSIQPVYGQTPQNILTMELLEGLDGRKMSSSWGNVINIVDEPQDMFGKIMSLEDKLIERYFLLTTKLSAKEIKSFLQTEAHPRNQKLRLAWEITNQYHGKKLADQAKQGFISQFSNKELPSDIEEKQIKAGTYSVTALLKDFGLATSTSDANRLLEQGGVKVNQEKFSDKSVTIHAKQKILLQVGKRKYLYLVCK
jgi:tyrosyl-tRNA synthetase